MSEAERQAAVDALMAARRTLAKGEDKAARAAVHAAKVALGERGPPWWDDGAPDYNRRMVENTPYFDPGFGLRRK